MEKGSVLSVDLLCFPALSICVSYDRFPWLLNQQSIKEIIKVATTPPVAININKGFKKGICTASISYMNDKGKDKICIN